MTENESAKPRVEVVEETQETLEIVEQDRLPRPEKMAREAKLLEDAHEARFVEREFVRRRKEPLDAVRAAVDALARRPVAFPEARPPPPPLPPEPEPEPQPPAVPEELRAALAPVVGGELLAAEVVHRETTGNVVEATVARKDGSTTKALFVIADGQARPFDDIAARIDALPTPAATAPAPQPLPPADAPAAPAPAPEAAVEEAPARKPRGALLGRFGKRDAAPEPDAPPAETPPKKGLLGRFGKGAGADAPADAPPAEEPAAEDAPKKPGLLARVGRKKKDAADAPEPSAESAGAAEPAEETPSKKRFGLRRK